MRNYGDDYDDLRDDDYYDEYGDPDEELDEDEDDAKPGSSRVNPFGKPGGSTSNLPGAGRSSAYGSSGTNRPGSPPGSSGTSSTGARPFGSSGTNTPGTSSTGARPYGGGSGSSSSSTSSGARPYGSGSGSSSSSTSSGARPYGGGSGSSSSSSTSSGARPYGGGSGSSSSSSTSSGARPYGSSSGSSSASAAPKKDSSSGGLLSKLPFGKSGDKKDTKSGSSSGGLGGFMNRGKDTATTSRPGGSKPATPKSGGGGLLSKLPFGKSGDKKPGAASSSSASSTSSSMYGRPSSSGPSASARPGSAPVGKPFGSLGGASTAAPGAGRAGVSSPARPAGAQKKGLFGFLQRDKADKKPAPKARPSKAPRVESGQGLTLDNKLDILGVGLVLGSLALFFSSLSTTKGALTEAINTFLSNTFGWGAVAIPLLMLAVGVWLIARYFGEEAPVLERVRLMGLVMLFLGLLVMLQFIESFNYTGERAIRTLDGLRLQLQISWEVYGAGGGWIGAQLYYLLVANVSEIGAFFVTLGWVLVAVMLAANLSFYQLAAIVISAARSFRDARQRRAQAKAAAEAARALAAQQAAAHISIAAPPPGEALPAGAAQALPGVSPAMPAPALPEPSRPERNIPITIGGRTISAFNSEELVPAETPHLPIAPAQPPAPAAASTPDDKAAASAPSGGLGARLRGVVPSFRGGKASPAAKPDAKQPAEKPAPEPDAAAHTPASAQASVSPASDKTPVKPAAPPSDGQPSGAGAQRWMRPQTDADAPDTPAETPAARLGDLMRPASVSSVHSPPAPAQTSTPGKPPDKQAGAQHADRADAQHDEQHAAQRDKQPASRLGDLMRPGAAPGVKAGDPPRSSAADASAAPGGPGLRDSAAASKPPAAFTTGDLDDDDELSESEELRRLPPAKPKGYVEPPDRAEESRSRFGPTVFGAPRSTPTTPAASAADEAKTKTDEAGQDEKPSLEERMQRLNAIRSGSLDPARSAGDGDKADKAAPAARNAPGQAQTPPRPFGVQQFSKPPAQPQPRPGDDDDNEHAKPAAVQHTHAAQPPSRPASAPPRPERDSQPAPRPAPVINPPGAAAVPQPAEPAPLPTASARRQKEWKLPDYVTLLRPGSEQDFDREQLLARARTIEDTLNSFGAPGKVVEVNTGPVITQFAVEPDYLVSRGGKKSRVKVSAIAQLDKDLQLALGAKSIRIEAPVPGKGYVGIEVPNEAPALVSLRDVMDSEEFRKIDSPLAIALGQSVDGTPVAADLGVMPHLLIAGTTGSGKSVCVNAIIASLLLRNQPDRLKFIMVDPKRVELTGYNGIPHLVAPVVVDLERIVGVLKWVTREMDERYKRFSNAGARNIEDFNKHLPLNEEIMPYIIVIIDELADLMMLAPDETERVITRIAALARATGIHLVIATQRPSVDVVTGLIKANFPARIAFAVASSVDSRVIIDQPGADRLLGRGDMLYMSGDSPAPLRLQGVFVGDTEINNINRFWKSQVAAGDVSSRPITQLVLDHTVAEPPRAVMPSNERQQIQQAFWDRDDDRSGRGAVVGIGAHGDGADDQEDELYEEAVEMVRRLNKASVSLLQRRLRIGYTRAARLIDLMEERGVVGPAESGSKPREVLPVKE